jgi:hypothetical protein
VATVCNLDAAWKNWSYSWVSILRCPAHGNHMCGFVAAPRRVRLRLLRVAVVCDAVWAAGTAEPVFMTLGRARHLSLG